MLSVSEIRDKIAWHNEEIRICEGKISRSRSEIELYKQDLIKAENAQKEKKSSTANKY